MRDERAAANARPRTLSRAAFVAAGAATFAPFGTAIAAVSLPDQIDHTYWMLANDRPLLRTFVRLGFRLDPNTTVQSDGSTSTFIEMRDLSYLEIARDTSAAGRRWEARGTNPVGGGIYTFHLQAARSALAANGLRPVEEHDPYMDIVAPRTDYLLGGFDYYGPPGRLSAAGRARALRRHAEYFKPALVNHPNGTLGLREVWFAAPDAARAVRRCLAAGLRIVNDDVQFSAIGARGASLAWGRVRVVIVGPTSATSRIGAAVARHGAHQFGVRVAANMRAAERHVVDYAERWGSSLVVGPEHLAGAYLAFGAEGTWS